MRFVQLSKAQVQFLNGVVIGTWCDKRHDIYISSEYKNIRVTVEDRKIFVVRDNDISLATGEKFLLRTLAVLTQKSSKHHPK